jgi:hypothetical protein
MVFKFMLVRTSVVQRGMGALAVIENFDEAILKLFGVGIKTPPSRHTQSFYSDPKCTLTPNLMRFATLDSRFRRTYAKASVGSRE